jgi:glycosyltransferase involved in cell wall biosynthesis
MKIFYDDIIFELQKAGGISKYWSKLIEFFANNENTKLVNFQGKDCRNNVFYPIHGKLNIVKEDMLPLKIKRYLPIFNVKGCDIFHSSYYRVPLFSHKNTKQIVTVHDFMYEFFDSGFKQKVHIWQKRKAMLKADAIICVSEHTKKDLLKLYPEVNSKLLHVVPNGVDKEFYQINDMHFTNKDYLLYVGNRVGCKNFEFVLKLMSSSMFIKNKNFKLICVGGGKFSEFEQHLFKKYDLESLVSQVLFIDNTKLNDLYNGAYALLFPSKYEGFGIPALEAQMAGCPVVYAKTSSLPEVMGYTELGYELDDVEEASIKLELLENKEFRSEIVTNGITHASKLTWENSAKMTLEVYTKVLNCE